MKLKNIALLIGCSLIFASSITLIKPVASQLPAAVISFLRTAIAAVCFLPFLKKREFEQVTYSAFTKFIFLGFFGTFLYNLLVFYALSLTSATTVALINAANPIFTLIATVLLFNHAPTIRTIIAFILSFLGVVVVITKGQFDVAILQTNIGELVMMIAMFSWVAYGLLVTRLTSLFSPLFITFCANIVGAIILFPIALSDNLVAHVSTMPLTLWMPILYNSIIGTALGFSLYAMGMHISGPSITTLVIFSTSPLFTAGFSYLLLGTPLVFSQAIGGLLVSVGLVIGLLGRKKISEIPSEPL